MNTHRYIARIIIEATTPLAVGSGERNVMTDHLVTKDVNGLPFIPGTALSGVLKHSLESIIDEKQLNNLFGFQNKEDGSGSRIILSSAQMIGKNGEVLDGLGAIDFSDEYYSHFENLPVRQHVRITDKGAAQKGGKFDEQLVYKGCRFSFELELVGDENDSQIWEKILKQFDIPSFRIGGGTRKGFGEIKVEECKSVELDLRNDLEQYLQKSSELNDSFWDKISTQELKYEGSNEAWIEYQLALKPDDFFLFGSGFESADADMTFVTEKVVIWENQKPQFTDEKVLIPASSVKGAIAHRLTYHYNKLANVFAETLSQEGILDDLRKKGYWISVSEESFEKAPLEERMEMVTNGNPATRSLFGYTTTDDKAKRGNLLLSDFVFSSAPDKKLLNHVAIDRFTGGAIAGALFSEEVAQGGEETVIFNLLVKESAIQQDSIEEAFENTLHDICNGMLPLGGGTMRGHGSFSGTLKKNGKEI